jgi:hypothetical protein
MKKCRLNLSLDAGDRKLIEQLRADTHAPTISMAIVRAARVHKYFNDAKSLGSTIFLKNKQSGNISEVLFL